jgi:hypothetical protein
LPLGFSIFLPSSLYEDLSLEYTHLEQRWAQKQLKKRELEKIAGQDLKTPVPNPKHNICQVCSSHYANYK